MKYIELLLTPLALTLKKSSNMSPTLQNVLSFGYQKGHSTTTVILIYDQTIEKIKTTQ